MTREEIHNEIGNILKLIEINNNRMFLNDADFELDLELMRSYVVQLYKLHDQLQVSQPSELEAPEPKAEPVVIKTSPKPRPKPKHVEPPVVEAPTPIPEPEPEPEPIAEVEIAVEEPVIEVEPPIVEEVVEEAPTEKAKPKPESKKAKPPVVANDVYARLKNTKLESIKKGISISKRYEIQNELFSNNPEVYNEAIKTLDSQVNFDDAMNHLEGTLMAEHGWEEDDFLVDEIRILLYRRYA